MQTALDAARPPTPLPRLRWDELLRQSGLRPAVLHRRARSPRNIRGRHDARFTGHRLESRRTFARWRVGRAQRRTSTEEGGFVGEVHALCRLGPRLRCVLLAVDRRGLGDQRGPACSSSRSSVVRFTRWAASSGAFRRLLHRPARSAPVLTMFDVLLLSVMVSVRLAVLLTYYSNDLFSALQTAFQGAATGNDAVRAFRHPRLLDGRLNILHHRGL